MVSTPATGQLRREILITVSPRSINCCAAAAPIPELAPVRIAMAGMLCPRRISGGDRVLQPRHRVTALRSIPGVFSVEGLAHLASITHHTASPF